ncbi:DUF4367 domain-containing protein [Desulfosporosinus sp. FKB]|uniref:DUF4367 domain-containing protein n=1 Tax=Desulfosporosinus sp. FKB TaxID=1969835 RepID=UPI000B49D02F|nr:DUF4367 domain-containing protein [Desulfosporosinus sp. FKB]
MTENFVRAGLHRAVDGIEIPQHLWASIQKKHVFRRNRRLYLRRVGLMATVLLIAIAIPLGSITSAFADDAEKSWLLRNGVGTFTITFVQNIGEKVAEITPDLFMPTTLSHAKQIAKIPIKLPTYLPEGITINDDTPTLVGRFGSAETVAIRVTQKFLTLDGSGRTISAESELLDIRETSATDVTMVGSDQGYTVEKVKIGENDGLIVLQTKSSLPLFINWSDGRYWFRIFCSSADRDTLIKIAESMR